jgi:D-sedoheptulose 7-phosphate isomerase
MKNYSETFQKEKVRIIDLFQNINIEKNFQNLCEKSIKALKKKRKIIFFGNGGSAADAQHLATELTVRFKKKRKALAALALTTDSSALTAIANDFDFKYVFSRQLEALAQKGDIVVALTTSGNSNNLIEAIKIANKIKAITFCFSGNKGGKLKRYVKHPIIINSNNTAAIQVVEIFMGQIFCQIIEDFFFKKSEK